MKSGLRRVRCLLLVVKLLMLIYRLRGELHTQLAEYLNIYVGQHDGGVDLAAPKFRKLCQGFFCGFIGGCAHAQGDKYLVGVETGVFAAHVFGL